MVGASLYLGSLESTKVKEPMTLILRAKPIYEKRLEGLRVRCGKLKEKNMVPHLKVFLVGNHAASLVYVRRKKRLVEEVGGVCEILQYSDDITVSEFQNHLEKFAQPPEVHGCLVQLPLPRHLSHLDVGQMIPVEKDVDGFHQKNVYHLFKGDEGAGLCACTPKGILSLLKEYGVKLAGQNALIIGRSLIVGKPLAFLLLNENASVSICHSHTRNMMDYTHRADLIISAVGQPKFFTRRFLHPERRDQVLIDVGISCDEAGQVCGDMDFEDLNSFCGAVSPVPGGVGPMTVLSLVENLITAAERSQRSQG